MIIAIIDDEEDVRDYYNQVCSRDGHTVVLFGDLVDALKYLRVNYVDVVFLDNHFSRIKRTPLYGVDFIPDIREAKPHCYIVLMSSKQFSTDMVKAAIENRIEFCLENPPEASEIVEVLRRVDLIRDREAKIVGDMLVTLRNSIEAPEGFFSRVVDAWKNGRKPSVELELQYVSKTNEAILLSPMKQVAHVARGDKITFESTISATRSKEFRADTKFGVGITLGNPDSVVGTIFGAKVKQTLEQSAGVKFEETIEKTYTQRVEIALHDKDVKLGAYSKNVYEGLVYDRHIVVARMCHARSGLEQTCELSCFVPRHFVTAVHLLNELGMTLVDERQQYTAWNLPRQLLQEISK